MTQGEWVSNSIALLAFVLSVIALWRTEQSKQRERETIVAIRSIWSGSIGWGDVHIPPSPKGPAQYVRRNPQPKVPDQKLVIDGSPLLVDGLILREARHNDYADLDKPTCYVYRVLLAFENVRGWAATKVAVDCTVRGRFPSHLDEPSEVLEFPGQRITIDALRSSNPTYVEIGNLPGIPTSIEFTSISAANKQPVKLVPIDPIDFQPAGYK